MTSLKSIIAATCIAALPIAMPAHSETYVRPADYVGMGETYYGTTPTSNGAIVETEVGPSRGRLIVNERPVLICELPMYVSEAYALLFGGVPEFRDQAQLALHDAPHRGVRDHHGHD